MQGDVIVNITSLREGHVTDTVDEEVGDSTGPAGNWMMEGTGYT